MPLPAVDVPAAVAVPRLDAALDDPAWNAAATLPALVLCVGKQAQGVTPLPTTVRLLWDANTLYVRFLCRGGDRYAPYGNKAGAAHYEGDVAEVFLDGAGDARAFWEIEASPANGVLTELHLVTAPTLTSGADGVLSPAILGRYTYDFPDYALPGLRTAAGPWTEDGKIVGWIADFALPAPPLLRETGSKRYAAGTSIHANFLRYDQLPQPDGKRKMVAMNWSPIVWGRPHRSPQAMGVLHLLPPENKTSGLPK